MDCVAVTDFIKTYPQYKRFSKSLSWNIERVGPSFDYDDTVHEYGLYAYHGVVMELFIRKYLCTQFDIDCKDDITEKIINDSYFNDKVLQEHISDNYYRFVNPFERALNIIDSIKTIGLCHNLVHNDTMEDFDDTSDMRVNYSNLKAIARFLDDLPYDKLTCKKFCNLQFDDARLVGVPHFIFDNRVFCQIATSMSDYVHYRKLSQMIFYIMGNYEKYYYNRGFYKKYTIMIYNPLKGLTYTTKITISPNYFEKFIARVEDDLIEMLYN